MAIIAAVLAIVIAAPEYARPAAGAALGPSASSDASPDPSAPPQAVPAVAPTSKAPDRLKGYRWPVRGGEIAQYYDWHKNGGFLIEGKRVHAGLVITWFDGAMVKAAHAGTVLAAGEDWASFAGYEGPLDEYYARFGQKSRPPLGIVIDDGNGYHSIYTEIKNLRVKVGDTVKAGQPIGEMSKAEKRQMMRYRLVRMDGEVMRVADPDRRRGLPDYAREHVDPLVVMNLGAKKRPSTDKRQSPADPPRLSDY